MPGVGTSAPGVSVSSTRTSRRHPPADAGHPAHRWRTADPTPAPREVPSMTSDHAPTSGRPAEPPGLPRQADQSGRAIPYRTTLTTALPFDDVLALVDEALAVWLKQEGHDEPPPADRSPRTERLRLGERVLLD